MTPDLSWKERYERLERETKELRKQLKEAESALHNLGYEQYGFGWGITVVEDSQPTLDAARTQKEPS